MRVTSAVSTAAIAAIVGCNFSAFGGDGGVGAPGDDDGTGSSGVSSSDEAPPADDGADGTAGGSTTSVGSSDGGSGGVQMEHLQHTEQTACDEPMWCYSESITEPFGGPQTSAECFTSTLPAPIGITRFHYVMPGHSAAAAPFVMHVWTHIGSGPGGSLHEVPMVPAKLQPGSNEILFDPPLVVDDPSFCIGFEVTAPGLEGGIGFAVDQPDELPGISYTRFLQSVGACDYPNWTDLATAPMNPPGNWCFDVDVQSPP